MITAIVRSNMELAKTTGNPYTQTKATNGSTSAPHSRGQSHASDSPVDIGRLDLNGDTYHTTAGAEVENSEPFMFIPPDPRAHFREFLKNCLIHDMNDENNETKFLGKKTQELLNEVGSRWRIPLVSQLVLLKDTVRELLNDQAITLDALDTTLSYTREPDVDKKASELSQLSDHTQWPVSDFIMNQQVLASIHEILLRDLFEQALLCFGAKPPEIGPIMIVLETQLYSDPLFTKTAQDLDRFREHLEDGLYQRAQEVYLTLSQENLSPEGEGEVEFYHIMQLGKAVFKHAERIQKRYRKMPEIMG